MLVYKEQENVVPAENTRFNPEKGKTVITKSDKRINLPQEALDGYWYNRNGKWVKPIEAVGNVQSVIMNGKYYPTDYWFVGLWVGKEFILGDKMTPSVFYKVRDYNPDFDKELPMYPVENLERPAWETIEEEIKWRFNSILISGKRFMQLIRSIGEIINVQKDVTGDFYHVVTKIGDIFQYYTDTVGKTDGILIIRKLEGLYHLVGSVDDNRVYYELTRQIKKIIED